MNGSVDRMDIHEARAWLDDHVDLERVGGDVAPPPPTLERMRSVVELLGSPQLEYPSLHVTGTNGKTSTARMMSALLAGLDVSTGSYTSPHLERVNERIARDGEPISDLDLADTLSRVALVEEFVPERPTFFEILTAAALSWFADVAVEAAVIEVGLGGTWDATNVISGDVAVVTNVSIDHVEYLGSSREEIAADKAGIVVEGSTLVLGETDPDLTGHFIDRDASRVLRRGVDFSVVGNLLAHGGRLVSLRTPEASYSDIALPLHGAHQAENAALALAAVEAFVGAPLPAQVVETAFASVTSPGRLEVVGHQPLVLLDGAHNVAGAHAMLAAVEEEFASSPRTLLVGLLQEKDPRGMLDALDARRAEHVVCARPPSPRAMNPAELARAARDLGIDDARITVVDRQVGDTSDAKRSAGGSAGGTVANVAEAVAAARALTDEDGQLLITGSLYLVGAARAAVFA